MGRRGVKNIILCKICFWSSYTNSVVIGKHDIKIIRQFEKLHFWPKLLPIAWTMAYRVFVHICVGLVGSHGLLVFLCHYCSPLRVFFWGGDGMESGCLDSRHQNHKNASFLLHEDPYTCCTNHSHYITQIGSKFKKFPSSVLGGEGSWCGFVFLSFQVSEVSQVS